MQELLLPGCHSVSGQGTGAACPGMKDAFCSSALPCGSQLWELGRSSFPRGIADARDHVCPREHSGACVWAHARLPACPQGNHLYGPAAMQRRGLSPTVVLQPHASQRCCWCCPGFTSHQEGLVKGVMSVCEPARLSQLGELCCTSTEFCHKAAQVIFFSCTKEWACGLWEC